jgi:8-hydroxy-5-deazaflavin:NADPH oxidoreductase
MTRSKIVVIGATGDLGFGLALRWAKAGLEVVIGSRDAERAEQAAERLRQRIPGAHVNGLVNEEAAGASDLVVVTVPYGGQAAIYKAIANQFRKDATVIDCTVPLATQVGGKAVHTLGVWQGSAAQQAQSLMSKDKGVLCSAFHTLAAGQLEDVEVPIEGDILVCGRKEAKTRVRDLVDAIPDLRYVDAGPLDAARLIEPLTALLIGINIRYKTRAGIRITGLPEVSAPS